MPWLANVSHPSWKPCAHSGQTNIVFEHCVALSREIENKDKAQHKSMGVLPSKRVTLFFTRHILDSHRCSHRIILCSKNISRLIHPSTWIRTSDCGLLPFTLCPSKPRPRCRSVLQETSRHAHRACHASGNRTAAGRLQRLPTLR